MKFLEGNLDYNNKNPIGNRFYELINFYGEYGKTFFLKK